MEILNAKIKLTFSHDFKINDKKFKSLFDDAIKSKPALIAFDLDFSYDGLEGAAHGIQIDPDTIESGTYKVSLKSGEEYSITADCVANVELMFMSEKQLSSFSKSNSTGKIKCSIASVCNNGTSRNSYWSMECSPYISLSSDAIHITEI